MLLTKLKILIFLFLFVFVLAIILLFFFFSSDIETFGNYQFEYVYDKGWPANYILVMKDGNKGNFDKIISGLVLEYYKEDDNIYFSGILLYKADRSRTNDSNAYCLGNKHNYCISIAAQAGRNHLAKESKQYFQNIADIPLVHY